MRIQSAPAKDVGVKFWMISPEEVEVSLSAYSQEKRFFNLAREKKDSVKKELQEAYENEIALCEPVDLMRPNGHFHFTVRQ